ncbi:DUF6318 family protein [Georgenia sp. Z1344]|uniref:DUF6318 family protein n=1 Tax=Georgenia sp. Z1344 TaxID=3416706 RepID=UPI003CF7E1EB
MTRPGGRHPCRFAALLLVGALGLTGCGGDDDNASETQRPPVYVGPDDESESGETASDDETPSESASGRESGTDGAEASTDDIEWTEWELERRERPEPEPPPEMDDDGEAGALAAAHYFVELIEHMVETGVSESFEAVSGADCGYCSSLVDSSIQNAIEGSYVDQYVIRVDESQVGAPTEDHPDWIVEFRGEEEAYSVVDFNGDEIEHVEPESFTMHIILSHTDGKWVLQAGAYTPGSEESAS